MYFFTLVLWGHIVTQAELCGFTGWENVAKVLPRNTYFILIFGFVCLITILFFYRRYRQLLQKLDMVNTKFQEASEVKDNFLARMSHDLRTPMNAITGMAHLAKTSEDPLETTECLEKIEQSCEFLQGLVNDILNMAHIEKNEITFNIEPYPYKEFQKYIEAVILPMCEEKKIKLKLEKPGELPGIPLMDRLRVNQIYYNLLSNAVKFTQEGGNIKATFIVKDCGNHQMMLLTSIQDNGIGMSREFQKELFTAFTQEEQEISSEVHGIGLGLSIAKRMVELMGGKIWVDSGLSEGTEFILQLPFAFQEVQEQENVIQKQENVLCGKHVLVCEDHKLNQQIAKKILEKKEIRVTLAENGQAGLEIFQNEKEHTFDLILMDIRMPGMDGLEATRQIRALERKDAKTIPIIAMTANALEQDRRKSKEAGMNEHMCKPINPDKLYECLAYWLDSGTGENGFRLS